MSTRSRKSAEGSTATAGSRSPSPAARARRSAPSPVASSSVSSVTGASSSGPHVALTAGSSPDYVPEYSVILPVYNERDNLPLMIAMLDKVFTEQRLPYEVVIVEDSSPDNTFEVACRLRECFGGDKIKILHRKGKLGLGSAYIDGIGLCKGRFVFIMDADMSHHPNAIPSFIAKQKEGDFDVVTGSRYIPGGGVWGWDLRRKLISRGANFLATFLLNPQVSDLTGSFRLYKREVIATIMPQVVSRGYVFQMEIITRCRYAGYSIGETPITFVDRLYGESKMGKSEILQYAQGLVKLFLTL